MVILINTDEDDDKKRKTVKCFSEGNLSSPLEREEGRGEER